MHSSNLAVSIMTFLLSGGFVGGLGTWVVTLRQDRREGKRDDRDAERDKVDIVLQLQERVNTVFEESLKAKQDAATAKAEMLWLRGMFASFVRPLISWIDAGAVPPPPPIPDELRRVLERVENHEEPQP